MLKSKNIHFYFSIFITFILVLSFTLAPIISIEDSYAYGDSSERKGSNTDIHTQKEIVSYMNSNPSTLKDVNLSALNTIKTIRFIAGIDSDLALSDSYIERAESAAIVCNAIGGISHSYKLSEVPKSVKPEVADMGVKALPHSNLARNTDPSKDLNWAIISGWMEDSDASNISTLGHRRWILNPSLGTTGFGYVTDYTGSYHTMWVGDFNNTNSDYYGVCWPAANMPISYFTPDSAWSYSLGAEIENVNAVSVMLTRKSDGKSWYFTSKHKGDGDFYISNNSFGQKGCIIFRPSGIDEYKDGDSFTVSILGVTTPDGNKINYTVDFFDAKAQLPGSFDISSLRLNSSNKPEIKWSDADNATFYRIYRMSSGGKWSLLKDGIFSSKYTDTTASPGIKYFYSVAAVKSINGKVNEKVAGTKSIVPVIATPLSKPVISSLTATGKKTNTLTWKKVNKATGYRIYRRIYGTSKWTRIKTISSSTTLSYKDTTAVSGTRYQYAVKAYRRNYSQNVYSLYSSWKSVKTK